jgi:hypothetical protein
MWYALLIILAPLVLLNSYTSFVVLRSHLNDERQKWMQVAFVWIVPILGSVVTLHALKLSHKDSSPLSGTPPMEYGDGAAGNGGCAPGMDCGE